MDFRAALRWFDFGNKVIQAGAPAVQAILKAAREAGVEADNALLDLMMAESEARKARREVEAKG